MAKKVVTLYIDDTSIRLLVSAGKRIVRYGELSLEPNLVKDGLIIDQTQVTARVKKLLRLQKVRSKKVVVATSGLRCLTRPVTLPLLPKNMLADAVIQEAQRVLIISLEEYYILWETIPSTDDKTHVFLVAVPRKSADVLFRTLRKAKLNPYLMDLKPLALARMPEEATAIIVDVQSTEFDIVIMTGGIPQPVRTISFGNNELSPQAKLSVIKDDLDRTIKFYDSNNPQSPLDTCTPIYISGEFADKPELYNSLSEDFVYPVLPLTSPLKSSQSFKQKPGMVNIGLVLKKLASRKNPSFLAVNINTLPEIYQPKPFSWVRVLAISVTLAVLGLLTPLVVSYQSVSSSITSMSNQLDTINQLTIEKQLQGRELQQNITELEQGITQAEASCDVFTNALDVLDKQGKNINDDLLAITNVLPETITLTNITHKLDIMTINGSAPGEKDILLYARELDTCGRFSETTISSIRKIDDASMSFTLVLITKGVD